MRAHTNIQYIYIYNIYILHTYINTEAVKDQLLVVNVGGIFFFILDLLNFNEIKTK